jgi:hypothetical protein
MEHSRPWEASSYSASREILRPKVQYRVHKIPQLVLVLSQMHPVHTFPPDLPNKELG